MTAAGVEGAGLGPGLTRESAAPTPRHVAAALDPLGGLLGTREFPAAAAGYVGLLGWLGKRATKPGRPPYPAGEGDAALRAVCKYALACANAWP